MPNHFDTLETRSSDERAAWLSISLPKQVTHAKNHSTWFAKSLAHCDPREVTTREALASLPVLRKHDLIELQRNRRPFGGLSTGGWGQLRRVFASPGPIYEPEGNATDYWRTARALFAAGFRAGDLVHNSLSYHMTPGAWILEAGALALGCTVFPAGVGQTEQQVEAMVDLQPTGYVGTPSFLRILLDKAEEMGEKVPSLTKALVSGEPFPPSAREALQARGIAGYQAYATADLGVIAYETEAREGLVVDEGVIVEIVYPGTGVPVPDGDVGEVVVTVFNETYPLIRFGTGDLSAVLAGNSPCGRTNMRIRGWLGRADQSTKVKGLFVHPEQVVAVIKRHHEVLRARLVVTSADSIDRMTLHVEATPSEVLSKALVDSVRDVTKLRCDVQFALPDGLPNDGKLISDERVYR
ncbi:MAG: AMP-binding protein [Candidatus Brocadiia bacterium]